MLSIHYALVAVHSILQGFPIFWFRYLTNYRINIEVNDLVLICWKLSVTAGELPATLATQWMKHHD